VFVFHHLFTTTCMTSSHQYTQSCSRLYYSSHVSQDHTLSPQYLYLICHYHTEALNNKHLLYPGIWPIDIYFTIVIKHNHLNIYTTPCDSYCLHVFHCLVTCRQRIMDAVHFSTRDSLCFSAAGLKGKGLRPGPEPFVSVTTLTSATSYSSISYKNLCFFSLRRCTHYIVASLQLSS
jgi:hypothetical protein